MSDTIQLHSEKTIKVRSGLYLEQQLFDQVKEVAQHNQLSVNETIVLLIKKGLQNNN